MVELLAGASGSQGMAGGQAIDLQSVGDDTRRRRSREYAHAQNWRFDPLLRAPRDLRRGTRPMSPQSRRWIDTPVCIGLTFQIRDDILDVEGTTAQIGKHRGQDQFLDKPTYVTILGLEAAKAKANALHATAIESLRGAWHGCRQSAPDCRFSSSDGIAEAVNITLKEHEPLVNILLISSGIPQGEHLSLF